MRSNIRNWYQSVVTPYTFRSLMLLLLIFTIMVWAIANSVKGLEFKLSWPIAAIGILLSWFMAGSKMKGWAASLILFSTGWGFVLIRVGRLDSLITDAFYNGLPSLSAIRAIIFDIFSKMIVLSNRFFAWMDTFGDGAPNYDPITLSLVWTIVVWLCAVWAAWAVRRHNHPPLAMSPTLIILAYSLEYIGARPTALLPMVGATIALMVLGTHNTHEQFWQNRGIGFSQIISQNSTWAAILLSLGLVILASITPSISIKQVIEYVRNTTSQVDDTEIGQSLGLEADPSKKTFNPLGNGSPDALGVKESGGLPTSQLIGSGPELSNRVMMRIKVSDPDRINISGGDIAPTYYFRSLTYDNYSGAGWSTGDTYSEIYSAGDVIPSPNASNQRKVELEFEMEEDTSGLGYSTGLFYSSNQEYRVAWREDPVNSPRNDFFGAVVGANPSYSVSSLLPVYGIEDLRGAGDNYPNWVKENYLGLPFSVTERTYLLAQELTATLPNPYDRAVAIEQYLRQFPYSLDLPAKPLGQDIADYFLFSLKRGYCDYYATSMIVLARAAGLPSRLVVGYIGSAYNKDTDQYVVTADLAHSWVEIYFPDYGWIQFEPTASRADIFRPPGSQEIVVNLIGSEGNSRDGTTVLQLDQILYPVGGLLLLLSAVWYLTDKVSLLSKSPNAAFENIYYRLKRFGTRIEIEPMKDDTPYEYANILATHFNELHARSKWGNLFGSSALDLNTIITDCANVFYSNSPPSRSDKTAAIKGYFRIRRKLFAAWVIYKFPLLK